MKNKVLYFPYINVPYNTWLTRTLLYWDKIGIIAPMEYMNHPERFYQYTRSLLQENLIEPIIPGMYVYSIPHFNESFINYLESNQEILAIRRMNFTNGSSSLIHLEKLNGIEQYFLEAHLARNDGGNWLRVEDDTARDFMAYLASSLGKVETLEYIPLTDSTDPLNDFILSSSSDLYTENQLSTLRLQILDNLFPAPEKPLELPDLLRLKERYGAELSRLRITVEREILTIASVPDVNLRLRRLAFFNSEIKEEIERISEHLRESCNQRISLSKIVSIITAIPGVNELFGLAKAVYDAFANDNNNNRNDSPFLYAYYAQRLLIRRE